MQTAPYQEFAREKLGFEFENIDYSGNSLRDREFFKCKFSGKYLNIFKIVKPNNV